MNRTFLASLVLLAISTGPALAWSDADEKAAIAAAGFEDAEACSQRMNEPVEYHVETLDLNADGTEEAFVTAMPPGDCFTSSSRRTTLVVKDASGQWKANITHLDIEIKILDEKSKGFPDITAGGGHYCNPIWRWSGSQYEIYKICKFGTSVSPSEAADVSPVGEYMHNGSLMTVDFQKGKIRYAKPKAAIAGTVKPGTLLFEGTFTSKSDIHDLIAIEGTAYVFKKGCDPAPYAVTGHFMSSSIWLRGPAPSRAKNSCAVLGPSQKSPHAILDFRVAGHQYRETLIDQKVPGFSLPLSTTRTWVAGTLDTRGSTDHSAHVSFFREGKRWRVEAECQATNLRTRKGTSVVGKGYVSLVGSALVGDIGPLGRLTVADHLMTLDHEVCGRGAPGYGTGD